MEDGVVMTVTSILHPYTLVFLSYHACIVSLVVIQWHSSCTQKNLTVTSL